MLKSKQGNYLGAIIRGRDRLNFKILENISGYKGLRMAKEEDIKKILGYDLGGVPAIIFYEKKIQTFVDINVLQLEYVIGSGGTEFYGMRFKSRLLIDRLDYTPMEIVRIKY